MTRVGPGKLQGSLRGRLFVRLWISLAVVVMLGAFGSFALARYVGTAVYDRWLYDSAMSLAVQVERQGGAPFHLPPSAVQMFEWDSSDRIYYAVTTSGGRQLFGNAVLPGPQGLSPGQVRYDTVSLNGRPVRVATVFVRNTHRPDDPTRVQVAETMVKRRALISQILAIAIPLQLILLGLVSAVIWYAVRSGLRSLDGVAIRVAGYEPDRLTVIDDVDRLPREVRPLLNAVNMLIGKLAVARAAERRFIDNAAHQLRTPLAALQVQAERAEREPDASLRGEALGNMLGGLRRLRHVVHQLLTLARSEQSDLVQLRMDPVDLAILAREAVEPWLDFAAERKVDLGCHGPDSGIWVSGDPHLLHELIGNLVDNAIRYGRHGGRVTLGVISTPPGLFVEDDGPGIALDDRELVSERFYRGAAAPPGGCGLGLAIVAEIAARHEASLCIGEGRDQTGCRIELIFRAPASDRHLRDEVAT